VKRSWRKNLAWALIVFALMWASYLAIMPWYNHAYNNHYPNQAALKNTPSPADMAPWPTVIILVPILEEIIFRGGPLFLFILVAREMITDKRKKKLLALLIIIASGITFSLMHYHNGGIYQLPPILILLAIHGALLMFLAIKTKNIYCSIVLHAAWNAM